MLNHNLVQLNHNFLLFARKKLDTFAEFGIIYIKETFLYADDQKILVA